MDGAVKPVLNLAHHVVYIHILTISKQRYKCVSMSHTQPVAKTVATVKRVWVI